MAAGLVCDAVAFAARARYVARMLPWTASAVVAGQFFGFAFAAGLNLYATLALIGLAARLGWIMELPPGVRGLSNTIVIGSAAVLFLLEVVVEKLPVIGALWAGLHTIIRPVAAALLAWLAVDMLPATERIAVALGVGLVAFAAHGAKTGLRVALASARRRRNAIWVAIAALTMDAIAIAIAIATLLMPAAAAAVAATALAVLVLVGPRLWRASTFGARALLARVVGFFGQRAWKPHDRLPGRIRAAVAAAPIGGRPPRGTRAAVLGLRGAGAFRNGWIIVAGARRSFIYRTLLGARVLPLPTLTGADVHPGPVMDLVRLHSDRTSFTIFLLKDGPAADLTVAELVETS
ncbi:MAG TPA: DUF4126 domain-containing protein [Longimicrobiales bacterium]|nr:DUF4126 domain-containing protein [Longimicrobiales bacterium]